MKNSMPAFILAVSLSVFPVAAFADARTGIPAAGCAAFLDSLGVNTHVDQGYDAEHYLAPLQYLGVRNLRDGQRNLSSTLMLHEKAGVRVDLLGGDVTNLTAAAKNLAEAGALLAIEGPNEPNNFPIAYQGQKGGGSGSWAPVAEVQKDLYAAVKADPVLKSYPVFAISEGGAETDNVGLQFLTIPAGANTTFPPGTAYADYANAHNYVSGHGSDYADNEAWQAADPTLNGRWDGLYVEYGRTWKEKFRGYSDAQLQTLPRVTSETGWDSVSSPGGERIQGVVLTNTYLAQFKRGWKYTFIYELGDGEGGAGDQGLYHKDWTPKPAAAYIHNLTAILADDKAPASLGRLDYAIADQPATVHDLLLQKSNGTFELVVWGEQASGSVPVDIKLDQVRQKVNIYDITAGSTPLRTLTGVSDVPLTLSDHAMVVEIP